MSSVVSHIPSADIFDASWFITSSERFPTLLQKEDLFESLLANMPIGLIVLDTSGCVIGCNRFAEAFFGDISLNQSWGEVVSNNISPKVDDGHELSLKNGRIVRIETVNILGGSLQVILVHDLTNTRHLQKSMYKKNKVALIGGTLKMIAHQIRTPLSSAMIYVDILHDNDDKIDTNDRKSYIQKIKTQLVSLQEQVSDILTFKEKNELTVEKMEAQALSEELKKRLKNIDIFSMQLLNQCEVVVNISVLVSALQNFVDNAHEASKDKSTVELTVSNDETHLCISISDDGPGLTPQDIANMFLDTYSTKSNGNGIGMLIAKNIIDSHQGNIEIDENVKIGAKFDIKLPVVNQLGV